MSVKLLFSAVLSLAALGCRVDEGPNAPTAMRTVAESTGKRTLRLRYFPIGVATFGPVTSDNVDVLGRLCVMKTQYEVVQVSRILASAEAAGPGQAFSEDLVRVKIVELDDDAGERVVAIIANNGIVRRDNVDQVLSETARTDLNRAIEAACPAENCIPACSFMTSLSFVLSQESRCQRTCGSSFEPDEVRLCEDLAYRAAHALDGAAHSAMLHAAITSRPARSGPIV